MLIRSLKAPEEFAVSLATAKLHIRVVEDEEDELINIWIAAAHQHCEQYLRRSLAPQTWGLQLNGFPCKRIYLPHGPVTAVSAITYRDVDGAVQTVASTDYRLSQNDEIDWVTPTGTYSWPVPQADTPDSVAITYKTGKAADLVAPQIRAAVLLLVGDMHEHREAQVEALLHENKAVMALLHPFRNYNERYITQDCCMDRAF
jgi:uncharacterized phiE125 gp8 family phage protein